MRKNLRRFLAFAGAVLMLAGALPCAAAEGEAQPDAPYQGFIFKLREDLPQVSLMAEGENELPEGVAELPFGYYWADSLDTLAAFTEAGWVESVEPDYEVQLMAVPNDPYYTGVADKQWYLNTIGMDYIWERGLTGKGVLIGVLDSGLNVDHEDILQKNLVSGKGNVILPGKHYFKDNPADMEHFTVLSDENTSEYRGHGTFVTGLIGAQTDNEIGIAGVAPDAEFLPIKVFDTDNDGYTSVIGAGLQWAVEAGCDIVNMSLGTAGDSGYLREAVKMAYEAGVILVASAGNGVDVKVGTVVRKDYECPCYPAAYSEVIGVGAVDSSGKLGWFSQRNDLSVDFTAPGVNIFSTSYENKNPKNTSYGSGDGTSFAAPLVTGIVALMKEVDPGLTQEECTALLRTTADSSVLDNANSSTLVGYGTGQVSIPDIFAAMGPGRLTWVGDTLNLSAFYMDRSGGEFLAASYTATGRMVSVASSLGTAEIWGMQLRDFPLNVPASATEVRVFLLEPGTGKPLGEAISLEIPPKTA